MNKELFIDFIEILTSDLNNKYNLNLKIEPFYFQDSNLGLLRNYPITNINDEKIADFRINDETNNILYLDIRDNQDHFNKLKFILFDIKNSLIKSLNNTLKLNEKIENLIHIIDNMYRPEYINSLIAPYNIYIDINENNHIIIKIINIQS